MMSKSNRPKPFTSLWFGNFFEPAYSDFAFQAQGIKTISEMNFDYVLLDSKAWEDFFDRYEGKPASLYVAGQEHMMEKMQENALHHWFLSIYLNGDNLYPTIRFSKPVIGEGITLLDGSEMRYYKYWSDKAQQSMVEHVRGLLRLYGDANGHAVFTLDGKERLPMTSMWDPIAAPSFDGDGICRYKGFLQQRHGDIDALNARYGTHISDFDALTPSDWLIDRDNAPLTKADIAAKNGRFYRYGDLMRYKAWELAEYFKSMQQKLHAVDERLYLAPCISQWSIFLNINRHDRNDLWDTANRGVDPYRIAPYVDCATFMTVPQLPDGTANAYVTEYQNSMIRVMNEGREFLTEFYVGKHTEGDIYRELSPAEIIGSQVASGAFGYHVYGYLGLDDGGCMHKLPKSFRDSIRLGNTWAKEVIPQITGKRQKQAAVLFPSQMALMENYMVEGNAARRLDSLGWYALCSDAGIMADVVHEDNIAAGCLADYKVLIVPENDCYEIEPNETAKQAVKAFVAGGGVLLLGSQHAYADIFGIGFTAHPKQCVRYHDGLILNDDDFYALTNLDAVAAYEDSKMTAISKLAYGKGVVYAFGFAAGMQYIAPRADSVPPKYGNKAYYPINLVEDDPMREILKAHVPSVLGAYTADGSVPNLEKNVSFAAFEGSLIICNHSSYPYDLSRFTGKLLPQYQAGEILLPHSAAAVIL